MGGRYMCNDTRSYIGLGLNGSVGSMACHELIVQLDIEGWSGTGVIVRRENPRRKQNESAFCTGFVCWGCDCGCLCRARRMWTPVDTRCGIGYVV